MPNPDSSALPSLGGSAPRPQEQQQGEGWTKKGQQQEPEPVGKLPGVRVVVCGGREYAKRAFAYLALHELHRSRVITFVIHGACVDRNNRLRGADLFAEEWAIANEVPYIGLPARWGKFGNAAGPIRNAEMLTQHPDVVMAFPGGRGTADMVRRAEAAGIEVMHPERDLVLAVDPSRSTPDATLPSEGARP